MPEMNHAAMAEAAAQWWADAIRNPVVDNGDPLSMAIAGPMIALANEGKPPHDEANLDAFKRHLADAVEKALETAWYVHLDVDYGPCEMLEAAADKAGLTMGYTSWPWKTSVHIPRDGPVTVRGGYGADGTQIYPAEPPK